MIITRTPLRISIGGGGTDLPSFYEREGGFFVAAAITKYIYLGINRTFTNDYFLKYSALERVEDISSIEHPLIREALRLRGVEPSVEIVSLADIPAGSGLGSSGSFTVGLLRAIHAFQHEHVSPAELAEEACHIEIDILETPCGKQDQYIAAYGGITTFEIARDGSVAARPLAISRQTRHDLEDNLLMFFTGFSRSAESMLEDQRKRSVERDPAMLDNLRFVKETGREIARRLECGDVRGFVELMHEHWLRKRERSKGMSNPSIDRWYDIAMKRGALGGKLVGAGNGGFLLFYAEDRDEVRRAMSEEGLAEVRFGFDHDGSMVTARG
ncbi:MAG: GHMP family kinase ATP-binding protein [Acidimicrobiia bacterium]